LDSKVEKNMFLQEEEAEAKEEEEEALHPKQREDPETKEEANNRLL